MCEELANILKSAAQIFYFQSSDVTFPLSSIPDMQRSMKHDGMSIFDFTTNGTRKPMDRWRIQDCQSHMTPGTCPQDRHPMHMGLE